MICTRAYALHKLHKLKIGTRNDKNCENRARQPSIVHFEHFSPSSPIRDNAATQLARNACFPPKPNRAPPKPNRTPPKCRPASVNRRFRHLSNSICLPSCWTIIERA